MRLASAKRLGVVMLTPGFYPYVGGAEKQALELSKVLASRGAAVTVLTRRLPGLPAAASVFGIPVRRTAAWGSGLVNSLVFLVSSFFYLLLHSREYRVIHVHLAGSPALAACLAGRLLGKRVVVKVGGGRGVGEISLSRGTLPGRLKLLFLRLFRPQFIAVTRDLKEELGEVGLGSGARVIPNGVDLKRYRPVSDPEKDRLRVQLGWPEGLTFLYVGRLSAEKRLDAFLKVFAAATREVPGKFLFVLMGSGREEPFLRALTARLGIKDKVLLLPPDDQVWRAYAAADVFVLPSISEGLSNALLEAMSTGLAVLASRSGGTPEVVEDGRSGFLFDPLDEGDMRAALDKLLKARELAGRMGAAARAAASERYAIEKVAELYLKLYEEKI